MILYAVECNGEITGYDWSIVTIWKNKDDANNAMNIYKRNVQETHASSDYRIKEIDTDSEESCIYDYDD